MDHDGTPEVWPPGTLVAGTPYRIVRKLGMGGMGVVYVALHTVAGTLCALKTIRRRFAGDRDFASRLQLEAHVLLCLHHPCIVLILDVGRTADGHVYYTMELLEGRSLRELFHSQRQLPLRQGLLYIIDVLAGLAVAHAAGVFHRDIKPHNIFVTREGRAKIIDFGVAKTLFKVVGKDPTASGLLLGTPAYLAPELLQRGGRASAQSDVYSVGVVLWQLVTGQSPFARGSVWQTLSEVTNKGVPRLETVGYDALPAGLALAIERATDPDPARRHDSALALWHDLRAIVATMPADGDAPARPSFASLPPPGDEDSASDDFSPGSRAWAGGAGAESAAGRPGVADLAPEDVEPTFLDALPLGLRAGLEPGSGGAGAAAPAAELDAGRGRAGGADPAGAGGAGSSSTLRNPGLAASLALVNPEGPTSSLMLGDPAGPTSSWAFVNPEGPTSSLVLGDPAGPSASSALGDPAGPSASLAGPPLPPSSGGGVAATKRSQAARLPPGAGAAARPPAEPVRFASEGELSRLRELVRSSARGERPAGAGAAGPNPRLRPDGGGGATLRSELPAVEPSAPRSPAVADGAAAPAAPRSPAVADGAAARGEAPRREAGRGDAAAGAGAGDDALNAEARTARALARLVAKIDEACAAGEPGPRYAIMRDDLVFVETVDAADGQVGPAGGGRAERGPADAATPRPARDGEGTRGRGGVKLGGAMRGPARDAGPEGTDDEGAWYALDADSNRVRLPDNWDQVDTLRPTPPPPPPAVAAPSALVAPPRAAAWALGAARRGAAWGRALAAGARTAARGWGGASVRWVRSPAARRWGARLGPAGFGAGATWAAMTLGPWLERTTLPRGLLAGAVAVGVVVCAMLGAWGVRRGRAVLPRGPAAPTGPPLAPDRPEGPPPAAPASGPPAAAATPERWPADLAASARNENPDEPRP